MLRKYIFFVGIFLICLSIPISAENSDSQSTSEWRMFRRHLNHTAYYPEEINITSFGIIWSYETENTVYSSPSIVNNIVYVGSTDNRIYALNSQNGDLIWNFTTAGPIYSSPAIANNIVYIGSNDNNLYALNASDGSKIWNYSTDNQVDSSPAVFNNKVFFQNDKSKFFALNASTGEHIWNQTLLISDSFSTTFSSSPSIKRDMIYVSSDELISPENSFFYAFNVTDGTQIWNYTIIDNKVAVTNTVAYDTVFALDFGGRVYFLNATTGNKIREVTLTSAGTGSLALAKQVLYGSTILETYAINSSNGANIWNTSIFKLGIPSPSIDNSHLFTAALRELFILNITDGSTITSIACGGNISSSPALADDMLFIGGGTNNKILAFSNGQMPSIEYTDPTTDSGLYYGKPDIVANVSALDNGALTITLSLYNSTSLIDSVISSSSYLFGNFSNLSYGTYYLNASANDTTENIKYTETKIIVLANPAPVPEFSSIFTLLIASIIIVSGLIAIRKKTT